MNEKLPDLGDVLDSLFQSYGLYHYPKYEATSQRRVKDNIKMKGWRNDIDAAMSIEVFVYEDNTVGCRFLCAEVELDLNVHDPDFLSKLESWIKTKTELALALKEKS